MRKIQKPNLEPWMGPESADQLFRLYGDSSQLIDNMYLLLLVQTLCRMSKNGRVGTKTFRIPPGLASDASKSHQECLEGS